MECNTLIHTKETVPLFKDLKGRLPRLKGIQINELEELQQQNHQAFVFDKSCNDAMRKPILILHSSGSTGMHFVISSTTFLSQVSALPLIYIPSLPNWSVTEIVLRCTKTNHHDAWHLRHV